MLTTRRTLQFLAAGLVVSLGTIALREYSAEPRLQAQSEWADLTEREIAAFGELSGEIEEYKANKADLERRIAIIEALKLDQHSPAPVLEALESLGARLVLHEAASDDSAVVARGAADGEETLRTLEERLAERGLEASVRRLPAGAPGEPAAESLYPDGGVAFEVVAVPRSAEGSGRAAE